MRVRHTTYGAPKPAPGPLAGLFATVRRPQLPIAADGRTTAVVPAELRRRRVYKCAICKARRCASVRTVCDVCRLQPAAAEFQPECEPESAAGWWEVELRTPKGHNRGYVLGLADAIAEAAGAVAHWRGRGYVMGLNLPIEIEARRVIVQWIDGRGGLQQMALGQLLAENDDAEIAAAVPALLAGRTVRIGGGAGPLAEVWLETEREL